MVRTNQPARRSKQCGRRTIGSKSQCRRRAPPCYKHRGRLSGLRQPTRVYSFRDRGARKVPKPSATSEPGFPFFSKLPQELRIRIWELATEDRRIVAVNNAKFGGLRSSVPPILHVCTESREVGLRVYTLSFAGQEDGPFDCEPAPARVYFNFERDILFFRRGWNLSGQGPWSCINYFKYLINPEDLQRVKSVGFDLKANVCSGQRDRNHMPNFYDWTGLKTLYLGLEKPNLGLDCQIEFHDLQPEDYSAFIEEYRKGSCWYQGLTPPEGAAGIEWIKAFTIKNYCHRGIQHEECEETLSPVLIIKL